MRGSVRQAAPLNLEAAKMVKYGGVTEAQALAMITINPARELGLEDRLGSIEVGKDADLALFNAHPFDGFARCELAPDRRRGLVPAAASRRASSRPGPATTRPCPAAAEAGAKAAGDRPPTPRGPTPWSAARCTR